MSFGLGKMVEEAENLLDQGRILPALELMKQARGMARVPFRKLFLTFNIGVVYWDKLGDGLAARNELLAAANFEGPELDAPAAREMQAGALENLMLSALSFEEFDNFTARLKAFAPEMPVVSGLPPAIAQMRDYGAPWSTALIQQMAMMNYNRNNPAQDRARYGVAKSTYHILLATRKQQRLSREDWRLVVFEYCALAMRMTNDCQIRRGGDDDKHSPEEFLPILTDAIPYMDEYLAIYTGDEDMQQVRDNMQSIVNNCRMRWAALSMRDAARMRSSPPTGTPAPARTPASYRCHRCRQPVPNPAQACPACGNPSPMAVLYPSVCLAAVMAGGAVWHYASGLPSWARWISTLGAAMFVFALVGPVLFQVWLSRLERKG